MLKIYGPYRSRTFRVVWIKVHGHLGLLTWDLADFIAASSLFYLEAMKYDFSDYPGLHKWLLESLARPAAQEAIKLRAGTVA